MNKINILYGFCRLRLTNNPGGGIFRELEGSSLVRELKVYGQVVPHFNTTEKKVYNTQHKGFGKKLMRTAEDKGITAKIPHNNFLKNIDAIIPMMIKENMMITMVELMSKLIRSLVMTIIPVKSPFNLLLKKLSI